MKSLLSLAGVFCLAMCLAGCPMNSSQQQQAAQASLQASTVLKTAQQGEIAAFNAGLISAPDNQFIQQQFISVATIGKTLDSCIAAASNKGGAIVCLNTAINGVDQINTSGGLYLKSKQAQTDFQLAITSIRAVFASIEATMGGTPPPAPVPAS